MVNCLSWPQRKLLSFWISVFRRIFLTFAAFSNLNGNQDSEPVLVGLWEEAGKYVIGQVESDPDTLKPGGIFGR